jgi:biotin carboxyl carrier protein
VKSAAKTVNPSMAEVVKMPKLSDTMTEGVVAKWHKKVGDKVKNGEILADIETDKATMEFESFFDGVLLGRGYFFFIEKCTSPHKWKARNKN